MSYSAFYLILISLVPAALAVTLGYGMAQDELGLGDKASATSIQVQPQSPLIPVLKYQ